MTKQKPKPKPQAKTDERATIVAEAKKMIKVVDNFLKGPKVSKS